MTEEPIGICYNATIMSERPPFLSPESPMPPTVRYFTGASQSVIFEDAARNAVAFGELHLQPQARFVSGIGLADSDESTSAAFVCGPRLNLLTPLLTARVLHHQTAMDMQVVVDTALGVNDWLHGRANPQKQDGSRAYVYAQHQVAPELFALDPELVDDLTLVLFSQGVELDWVGTYRSKNAVELGTMPFLDKLAEVHL